MSSSLDPTGGNDALLAGGSGAGAGGVVVLAGANAYSAGTTLLAGAVNFSEGSLGTGPVTFDPGAGKSALLVWGGAPTRPTFPPKG